MNLFWKSPLPRMRNVLSRETGFIFRLSGVKMLRFFRQGSFWRFTENKVAAPVFHRDCGIMDVWPELTLA
jgi:hypothetical protein